MVDCTASSEKSSSLVQTGTQDNIIFKQLKNINCPVNQIDATKKSFYHLISPCKERCFNDSEMIVLNQMYSLLYPCSSITPLQFYFQCGKLLINDEEFLCDNSLSKRSSTIVAKWPGVLHIDPRGEAPLRVANVHYYIEHNVTITENGISSSVPHILAKVSWFMDHPKRDYLYFVYSRACASHSGQLCLLSNIVAIDL